MRTLYSLERHQRESPHLHAGIGSRDCDTRYSSTRLGHHWHQYTPCRTQGMSQQGTIGKCHRTLLACRTRFPQRDTQCSQLESCTSFRRSSRRQPNIPQTTSSLKATCTSRRRSSCRSTCSHCQGSHILHQPRRYRCRTPTLPSCRRRASTCERCYQSSPSILYGYTNSNQLRFRRYSARP